MDVDVVPATVDAYCAHCQERIYREDCAAGSPAARLMYAPLDTISLHLRIAELEAALEPFARRAEHYDRHPADCALELEHSGSPDHLTVGQLRAALAALDNVLVGDVEEDGAPVICADCMVEMAAEEAETRPGWGGEAVS